ncbi:hypothetical protein R1sor_003612 [Riccia sorocarpa]|uniref:Uncharacterized protein n=1 Tax=Riccia sorocarpa TaxID=122646 RepID=A0ABD3H232_9MARC
MSNDDFPFILSGGPAHTCHRACNPTAEDVPRHLSSSGSSPSSDSEDSTDFSPIKIAEKDLGLSLLRLLPGFAASIKKRKQFLASMSPPRELFSQFLALAPLGNAETEEHEENAQDENEDDGPFASEALSDSEEDKSPEQVLVTRRRFKKLFVKRNHQGSKLEIAGNDDQAKWTQPADGKYHLPNNFTKKEVYDHYRTDMVQFAYKSVFGIFAEVVQALKLHRKQHAEERAAAGRRRWKALDSPKDCAYIQIDGMDQKKTALPHFSKQPKSVDGAALVGVHLVGAMIFHGKLHTPGVRNILHIDGSRAILASEQVPLKSYAEIKRQTRRVQNIEPLIGRQEGEAVRHVQAIRQDIQIHCYPFFDDEQKDWWNHWFVQQEEIGRNIGNNRWERLVGDMWWFWPVPPERDEHVVDEPVAVTTTEEFRRRIFGQRRPIYFGPR